MGANIMTANFDIHLITLYICEANGVAQARRWRLPCHTSNCQLAFALTDRRLANEQAKLACS